MENPTEVLEPQKIQEPVVPVKETLTEEQIADLKHKAEVSSQNFERAKKAELELKALKENTINEVPSESEAWSDEGKVLEGKMKAQGSELSELKQKLAKMEVLESHPMLKDMWTELEDFRNDPENKGMNLKTAAKSFLIEKGLLEPKRKGLEAPTGGPKATPSYGTMTTDEAKDLRENNPRKYREMLVKDQIKIAG